MKVLLICPPDYQLQFAIVPSFFFHADDSSRLPPLGLLYIAAHLKAHTDHEVEVLDAQTEQLSYDDIENKIRSCKPDVIGITAFTPTFLDAIEIARCAKKVNPGIFVVLGGPHARIYPAETVMLADVDAVVPDEGEKTMTELVEALANGSDLTQVPGLYLQSDSDAPIITPTRPLIADLDTIPFPARSLLPVNEYKFVTDEQQYSTTMVSSRGCRFKCTFCDIPYHEIRARTPESIVAEMAECVELGYGQINFYDDNFNFNKDRVLAICNAIIEKGINTQFSIRARVDNIDPEILDALRKAGCCRINFGIEAGDNESLKMIRKGITTDMARRAVKLSREAGIEVVGYYLISIPGQTEEQIRKTIDFAIELDTDYAQFIWFFLFPGTEVYRDALRSGAFDSDFYQEFAESPSNFEVIAYWPNPFPFEVAQKYTKLAYRRFYLRPSYILRQFFKLRSFSELIKKSRAGMDVITYSIFPWKAYRPPSLRKKSVKG